MKKDQAFVFVLPVVCILFLSCLSCREEKYLVGNKLYSGTELLAMQKQKNDAMLSQIAPTDTPVGGSVVVIIPTDEFFAQTYGFANGGSRPDATPDLWLQLSVNPFMTMVEAVRRRGLFETVECRRSTDPERETFEIDFALIRPAKKETDWLLKTRTQMSQDAALVRLGPSGSSPLQWMMVWLNNVEEAAREATRPRSQ